MAPERSISLRDAGLRLAQSLNSNEKVASGKLLSLLKAGQINAGFQFPGTTVWWIKIPTQYWASVSTDKFRVIRFSETRSSGAFKVPLGDFANEIVAQISQQREGEHAPTSEEWKAVLKATTRKYEVEIIEREWAAFLARNAEYSMQIPSKQKSNSGRHQKEGWRDLSVIIGAYIMKHCETTKELIKIEEASIKIYDIAKSDEIRDLPAPSTIKDVISKISARAATISIN